MFYVIILLLLLLLHTGTILQAVIHECTIADVSNQIILCTEIFEGLSRHVESPISEHCTSVFQNYSNTAQYRMLTVSPIITSIVNSHDIVSLIYSPRKVAESQILTDSRCSWKILNESTTDFVINDK